MFRDYCFTGIQIQGESFDGRPEGETLDEIQHLVPLNALLLFHGDRIRRTPGHRGGTHFAHPVEGLDKDGKALLDRLEKPAAKRGIDIYLGVGEDRWGYHEAYAGYSSIAMVDCFGRINRQSCVANPTWRNFQFSSIEDAVREHPFLKGIMFMHERVGPLSSIFFPGQWQGGPNPWCFCEHCCRRGRDKGIDPERARTGYKKLLELFGEDRTGPDPTDGFFITFWRILTQYHEILAWEQLQWDNLQDFRAGVAGTAKMVNPEVEVGFHFQHATINAQLVWRAAEDPQRVSEYADWVKPSVYPGVSGSRYLPQYKRLKETLFADLDPAVVQTVIAGIFLRDASIGADMLHKESDEQGYFPAEWVKNEVARLKNNVSPKPVYAGLGIGVPGGEKTETPERVAAWTEACFDGGADGLMISRHYSEMKHDLLKACGEVIKARGKKQAGHRD